MTILPVDFFFQGDKLGDPTKYYLTYTELKQIAIPDSAGAVLVGGRSSLNDGGGGIFIWSGEDHSATGTNNVPNDPNEYTYVPPDSDTSGASGAWVHHETRALADIVRMGDWTFTRSSSYLYIEHADSTTSWVMRLADGSSTSDSHRIHLPWDARINGHVFIAGPSTAGGIPPDILFRRAGDDADAFGNRFSITYDDDVDRLGIAFATTASGSPGFDNAIEVHAGDHSSSPNVLLFPATPVVFQDKSRWELRSGATHRLEYDVNAASVDVNMTELSTSTTTRVGQFTDPQVEWGAETFLPAPRDHTIEGHVSTGQGTASVAENSSFTRNLAGNVDMMGGTIKMAMRGTSGAGLGMKFWSFEYDGSAVTEHTPLVDTLNSAVTATLSVVANTLVLTVDYTTGLGSALRFTYAVDTVGRQF